MNILYIGSLSRRRNRLDGVTIKSRVLEQWLKDKKNITLHVVDVDEWKVNFIIIIYKILSKYRLCDKIIICSSSRGAAIFLKFLRIIKNKKDIYYFVAGGKLASMIKKGIMDINLYKDLKKIYIEPIDMAQEMRELGLCNIEQKNNFRNVIDRPKYKKCIKDIRFVFFSRVIKEKGIEEGIKSFSELKKKYKNITLDIYGQVSDQYLSELRKTFIDGITYKGVIMPNNYNEYSILSKYDIFILPTYHEGEGLPGALIDAYISGLAVIVSDWKYSKQYVNEGKVGLIHKYRDYNDLVNKMEFMIQNKDMINYFKRNSYMKAEEFLSDFVLKDLTLELLQER